MTNMSFRDPIFLSGSEKYCAKHHLEMDQVAGKNGLTGLRECYSLTSYGFRSTPMLMQKHRADVIQNRFEMSRSAIRQTQILRPRYGLFRGRSVNVTFRVNFPAHLRDGKLFKVKGEICPIEEIAQKLIEIDLPHSRG